MTSIRNDRENALTGCQRIKAIDRNVKINTYPTSLIMSGNKLTTFKQNYSNKN